MNDRSIWPFVYVAIGFFSALGGAESVRPDHTDSTNVDWVFVSISFIMLLAVPSIAVSNKKSVRPLPKPSLSRFLQGSWQKDPLQSLLITAIVLGGTAIGSIAGLVWPHTNQGTMIAIWYWAMFLGLSIGSIFIRGRLYSA